MTEIKKTMKIMKFHDFCSKNIFSQKHSPVLLAHSRDLWGTGNGLRGSVWRLRHEFSHQQVLRCPCSQLIVFVEKS